MSKSALHCNHRLMCGILLNYSMYKSMERPVEKGRLKNKLFQSPQQQAKKNFQKSMSFPVRQVKGPEKKCLRRASVHEARVETAFPHGIPSAYPSEQPLQTKAVAAMR